MNILWLLTGGIVVSIIWFLLALLSFVSLIGIPFGLDALKMSKFSFNPFGKNVVIKFDKHPILNVIWLILFGWEIFFIQLLFGAILCMTIVGIPFGLQWFKMAKLSFFPYGAIIS